MQLKIETSIFGKKDAEVISEFISTSQAIETEIKDGFIVAKEGCNLTQAELFDFGLEYGKETEKAFWKKPESFLLQTKYAGFLKTAISDYQRESFIRVDTIEFKEIQDSDMIEIIFTPTQVHCLFGIISRYGALCCLDEPGKYKD